MNGIGEEFRYGRLGGVSASPSTPQKHGHFFIDHQIGLMAGGAKDFPILCRFQILSERWRDPVEA